MNRPCFLITIDTEGDNLWARSQTITTRNSEYLPRFQSLCEKYGFKPTWLTTWEMANCPLYRQFAGDVIARSAGEIGMHLHAWNSPSIVPLTDDDHKHHPYLIEFPEHLLNEKVHVITETLEQIFDQKMLSHRAGRWGFNEIYAKALVNHGYRVDCSVTPHLSWRAYKGVPHGGGGPDFSNFPETPYFLDLNDIRQPGDSPLLEVPMTVTVPHYSRLAKLTRDASRRCGALGQRIARRFFPTHARLVPNGRNRRLLLAIVKAAILDQRNHLEFMIHSSELMPGGSPNFDTAGKIERLFDDLHALFSFAAPHFRGCTLAEYYECFGAFARAQGASPGETRLARGLAFSL